MKNIFVKKLYLWPRFAKFCEYSKERFRDIVDSSLQKHRPDVVELHQPFTPSMKAIQSSILEIMEACIDELKKNTLVLFLYVVCNPTS